MKMMPRRFWTKNEIINEWVYHHQRSLDVFTKQKRHLLIELTKQKQKIEHKYQKLLILKSQILQTSWKN